MKKLPALVSLIIAVFLTMFTAYAVNISDVNQDVKKFDAGIIIVESICIIVLLALIFNT